MFRRGGKNLNPDHMPATRTATEIWRATSKYDLFLIGDLVKPFVKPLEGNFDDQTIANPTEQDFEELTKFLGKLWSRAAVYSVITHLSLSPMPAQAFALAFVSDLEKRRISEAGFEESLKEIEFASEDLIAEATNHHSDKSDSPIANGNELSAKDTIDIYTCSARNRTRRYR